MLIILISSSSSITGNKRIYSSSLEELAENIVYSSLMHEINITRIKEHILYLSSLDTRCMGSKGYEQAAMYIYDCFKSFGLSNVSYHFYKTATEICYGAYLQVNFPVYLNITLHPLKSNLVVPSTTPLKGISGRLVYVGKGSWQELNGKPISNSIVLMDFNSENNWLNVAMLGAKAVIFIEPKDTSTKEAELKYVDIPLYFPRFYITSDDANKLLSLLKEGIEVTCDIKSKVVWKEITAKNVIGIVKGSEYPDKYILISSYFDSSSVVLTLGSCAEETTGVAVLLEYARYFSKHKPLYSILFVAFSGHSNGLAGSRWFTEDYLWGEKSYIGRNIIAQFNLDLNSKSRYIQLVDRGGMYDRGIQEEGELTFERLVKLERIIQKKTGLKCFYLVPPVTPSSVDRNAWREIPRDNEPLLLARAPAYSFTSVLWSRKYYMTPLDTPDRINLKNLEAIAKAIFCFIYTIANIKNVEEVVFWKWSPDRFSKYLSNQKIVGTVVEWNSSIGWYQPVPRALICTSYSAVSYTHLTLPTN